MSRLLHRLVHSNWGAASLGQQTASQEAKLKSGVASQGSNWRGRLTLMRHASAGRSRPIPKGRPHVLICILFGQFVCIH